SNHPPYAPTTYPLSLHDALPIYQHIDANHLEELLRRKGKQAGRRLIVTESVFSMDGDWAPLPDLLVLAQRHDALLLIDEAHASRSEEHTSELQSRFDLVCRLLLE